jgi:hypothetical protein
MLIQILKRGAILSLYDPYFVGEEVFGIKTAPSVEEGVRR